MERYKKILNYQFEVNLVDPEISLSSSKFLVPKMWEIILTEKKNQFGGLRLYFNYLLKKYGYVLQWNRFEPDLKASVMDSYQEDGLNLEEFGFRPFKADWQEFKIYKQLMSVSMCFLFVYLLKLDFAGFPGEEELAEKSVDVPTEFKRAKICLTEENDYLRKFSFRKLEILEKIT